MVALLDEAMMPAYQGTLLGNLQMGRALRVTSAVLSVPGAKKLHDAPGGVWVCLELRRGVLHGGVDAVLVLLQNRYGQVVLRALNIKSAVKAYSSMLYQVKQVGMKAALGQDPSRVAAD